MVDDRFDLGFWRWCWGFLLWRIRAVLFLVLVGRNGYQLASGSVLGVKSDVSECKCDLPTKPGRDRLWSPLLSDG